MLAQPDRVPSTPPVIAPVPASTTRPLWSVMIPTYNCSEYLTTALTSVLAQDMGADIMQIQVVDDASTDEDVAQLVATIGQGRVEYFRQERNVGSLRNFETCLNNSRGHLIHILHADDRVREKFYESMNTLFEQYPQAGAAFSRYASINESGTTHYLQPAVSDKDGLLDDWLTRIAQYQSIQYACIVVRRSVYEHLGSFYGNEYGEDWEMWVRIARHYPVAYTNKLLAEYRSRAHSITWRKLRTGTLVTDLLQVLERIQHHLPEQSRERILYNTKKYWANINVYSAFVRYKNTHDRTAAHEQMKKSLLLSNDISVYYTILKNFIKTYIY